VTSLRYAVITPAHNEADNLRRLAACMQAQSVSPTEWMIVDNGSTDGTAQVLGELTTAVPWVHSISVPRADDSAPRGAPVVQGFHAGLAALGDLPDIVTKLDADVEFESDFFARILDAFDEDPHLGITGGVCYETDTTGVWKPTHVTRGHVRGATRAYRSTCLADVLPLVERMGWDGIDELRARVAGWETRSLEDLPFLHHRPLGAREHEWGKWIGQGRMAHYMGYRAWYVGARTVFRSIREPRAMAMLWGFAGAALRHEERYPDRAVRDYLRRQQSIRALPTRIREALGRTAPGRYSN
jgi:glycosyltransferase involved in cell wall biosynthesis